jgi:hypothetical protein
MNPAMLSANDGGNRAAIENVANKKTPRPREEAAFCLIMISKEELLCPWQAWQRPTLPGLKP